MSAFSPDDRELQLSQWTYVLGLGGVADVMVEVSGEIIEEWASTPRWRWLRRRRLMRESEVAWRLCQAFYRYAQSQSQVEALSVVEG